MSNQKVVESMDDLIMHGYAPGTSVLDTPLTGSNNDNSPFDDSSDEEEHVEGDEENSEDKEEESEEVQIEEDVEKQKQRKYAHEDQQHENWPKHNKHIFILSSSGRPIYSRYGDESALASFMAILQVFVSFVVDSEDTIRCAIAGDHKIVFVIKGPIYLVCVSKTGESKQQLAQQLNYMHAQIISTLTSGINKVFKKRPHYDIRNILSGTEKFMDSLMSWVDHDYAMAMNAIHCLRINSAQRSAIGNIMIQAKTSTAPNLLYAILVTKYQLINIVRPRKHILHSNDLHLLLNFVNSSTTFRNNETWTPLCLPKFNDAGYLYAYISYLSTDVCLILITAEMEDFYQLSECRKMVAQRLTAGENSIMNYLENVVKRPEYSVSEVNAPGLLHFLYKSLGTSQITYPKLDPPYNSRKDRKRLFRLYQKVYWRVNQDHTGASRIYLHTSEHESILAWITGGFQLFAVFGPLESLPVVIKGCNVILQWIKGEENNIFVLDSPVFNLN